MWKFRCTLTVLALQVVWDCKGQHFTTPPCLALSFTETQEVARCSPTQTCPTDSSYCYLMNPLSHFGTCCLGCGRRASDPTVTCTSDAGCQSAEAGVRLRCRKPNHKTDALGVCCEMSGGY